MNLPLDVLPAPTAAPASTQKTFFEYQPEELEQWLAGHNQPKHRARQILRQVMHNRKTSYAEMTDLPAALRAELTSAIPLFSCRVDTHQISSDETHKLLVRLKDGRSIESVLIQESPRRTACISTQVGCAMGCVFCASGLNGVERNLTRTEILEQLILLRNLTPAGDRLSHVVVMGMGEPMANLNNLIEALDLACSPEGLGIGARHVTISTVGLPEKMKRFADMQKQYHLAVSLHAPNDPLRTQIVPTNEKTGILDILEACDYFVQKTGRQVTYEYILIGSVNDSPRHARELVSLVRGRVAHVNLIPWNPVSGLPFQRPTEDNKTAFIQALRQAGISVKVRKRKGADIDAACGQLRRKLEKTSPVALIETNT